MEKKRVLITGMAGFIGFNLAASLATQNIYEIIGLDNINDYYDTSLKYDRLKELGFEQAGLNGSLSQSGKYTSLQFIRMDLEHAASLQNLFSDQRFHLVVHLGAQAGVRHSLSNPHAYVNSNITGFLNILECCKNQKVQHLIYASSSSVYGQNSAIPFSEKEITNHPVSLYAATKKANELMAYTYSHLYGLHVTGLRFFTVYGPWGRPDMSPMLFAKAICEGQPIKVFNYGKMRRDFTYVGDIVEGIRKVLKMRPASYKIYNIGNSKPVDLMDFIELMEKSIGRPAQKELVPMQPGDVYETYADTSALERDTGYHPTTTLDVGIKKFLDWYMDYYRCRS